MSTVNRSDTATFYRRSCIWPWVMLSASVALALIVAALFMRSHEARTLVLVLSSYFVLCVLSEVRGVALAARSVTFPYRLFKSFPLPVPLRRTLDLADIYVIYSYDSSSIQKCAITTFRGDKAIVYFPDRDAKYAFFWSMNEINREIKMVRAAKPA
ncbi:hypothetical protein WOC76_13015 [Methylocystis sp. IM3]|uniref:hypothetical protein n=1 Tax=unclassified Methylocystis TaxID=2625913 RepID=UPI0030FCF6D2